MAWADREHKFGRWLSDLFGVGGPDDTWGVSDTTGSYSGRWGTGPAGSDYDWYGSLGGPSDTPEWGGGSGDVPDLAALKKMLADAQAEASGAIDPLMQQTQDLMDQASNLPSFTEWLQQQGTEMGDTSGIQGLIDALSGQLAGLDPSSEEAKAFAAQMGGFDTWEERQAFMQSLQQQMENSMGVQQAYLAGEDVLSPLQQQAARRATAEMERRAERLIADSYSNSGSIGRMMLQADETLNQIQDSNIQMRAQMAQDTFAGALAQFQNISAQYTQMYQAGEMSATDFVDARRQALSEAIQGYSVEMDAILRQNEQYFEQYDRDYQSIVDSIQLTFAGIQMELGLTQAEYDLAQQAFMQALAPYYTAQELQAMADATGIDWSDVASLISAAAQIIAVL